MVAPWLAEWTTVTRSRRGHIGFGDPIDPVVALRSVSAQRANHTPHPAGPTSHDVEGPYAADFRWRVRSGTLSGGVFDAPALGQAIWSGVVGDSICFVVRWRSLIPSAD
jgi:hypothetical protein